MTSAERGDDSQLDVIRGVSAGGPLLRVIGDKDVDGEGIRADLPTLDPFMLLDCITVPYDKEKAPPSPFSAHPHSNIAACSVHLEGPPMHLWDNHVGDLDETLDAGGVSVLRSAKGCCHDEQFAAGAAPAGAWRGDGADRIVFFQLFINLGDAYLAAPPPAATHLIRRDAVPVARSDGLEARVLLGELGGARAPPVAHYGDPAQRPVTILHCRAAAGGGGGALTQPPGTNCFIHAVKGTGPGCRVAVAEDGGRRAAAVLHGGELAALRESAAAREIHIGEGAEVLVGIGVPHRRPLVKLIAWQGALCAETEEGVRDVCSQYEQDPAGFGRSPDAAAPASLSRFTFCEGFKNKGDDLRPGVRARYCDDRHPPPPPKM